MHLLALPSCLLQLVFARDVLALPDSSIAPRAVPERANALLQIGLASLRRLYPQISQGRFNAWELVQVMAWCSLLPGFWYLQRTRKEGISLPWSSTGRQRRLPGAKSIDKEGKFSNPSCCTLLTRTTPLEAEIDDPALLKKHSEIRSFTTSRFTYPSLRIFFRRHPQAEKLPTTPAPLPLLVFIHGLGGSSYQFHSLLSSLVHLASCLSIDLPGCGLSGFKPTSWDAYTTEALAELLETVIEEYREKDTGQGVVLIGHSMGCSLAALLATHSSPHKRPLSDHVVGLVSICPRAEPPTKDEVALFRKLLYIPTPVFDLWRRWDRRGGLESASIRRFVGADADEETKKLQNRFNNQSRSAVWRRMASGSLPTYKDGVAHGGLPGREVWSGLECPVFLVAGEADHITKATELAKISEFLGKSHPVQIELNEDSEPIVDAAAPVDISIEGGTPHPSPMQIDTTVAKAPVDDGPDATDSHEDPSTPNDDLAMIPPQLTRPKKVLKTTILPAPASHALLYMPSTVRILAGLISDFMCSQVSPRLSLGWQLQFLSTAGKWDVKNLAKWQAVAPVSKPIAGIFRALKTLRQVDDIHSPERFVKDWGSQIKDIVDISHETPVYDPRDLEKGGVRYHKFPTVSKIPPTNEEVNTFIALIDRLREEQKLRAEKEGWGDEWYIGVHCHYGFNRTGYFISCYLVERCGYSVQAAIDAFAQSRPKGIKHAHFLDQLFVRYCVGLKRAPTL